MEEKFEPKPRDLVLYNYSLREQSSSGILFVLAVSDPFDQGDLLMMKGNRYYHCLSEGGKMLVLDKRTNFYLYSNVISRPL